MDHGTLLPPSRGGFAVDPSHIGWKSCGVSGIPFDSLHRLGWTGQYRESFQKSIMPLADVNDCGYTASFGFVIYQASLPAG